MKLSARSRYGARLLLDLAQHGQGRPVHLTEVATREELPVKFLEQIAIPLRQAGLLTSVRGPKGGYLLARPPAEISLAEVVAVLEGEELTDCLADAGRCRRVGTCLTRRVWQEAGRAFYDKLRSISLADLLNQGREFPEENGHVQPRGPGAFQ
jgi:Rrf2 family protein